MKKQTVRRPVNAAVIITVLLAVLLSGCGKQTGTAGIFGKDAGTVAPAAAEEAGDRDGWRTGDARAREGSAGAGNVEAGGTGFSVLSSLEAEEFEYDYGFSEDRAWVRSDDGTVCLIDPEGRIVYEIPGTVTIAGQDSPVTFEHFYPVRNGTAYITGECNYTYPVSVIVDANGIEIARFVGNDETACYIAGRTEDRFLLVCLDRSEVVSNRLFCVPIGRDGKEADDPRLVSEGYVSEYSARVYDMGEGIFGLTGIDEEHDAFYDLGSNTVQKTARGFIGNALSSSSARFQNGVALLDGFRLTAEQLREDRVNLVLRDSAGYVEDYWDPMTQFGRVWCSCWSYDREQGLYDQNGARIDVPGEIGSAMGYTYLDASDDGYVLFWETSASGKTLLSMMAPDNSFLYVQKVFPENTYPRIGRGGYAVAGVWEDEESYGVIDRTGGMHSFREDLSGLKDLSGLVFKGFGSGVLLETETHLSEDGSGSGAVIRSLDGSRETAFLTRTSETRTMAGTLSGAAVPDFSRARPVGSSGSGSAEATGEEEIRGMEEYGVIVVDGLLDEDLEVLLFEREGVRVTLSYSADWYGWRYEVENRNPENRKVQFSTSPQVLYDGIYLDALRGSTDSALLEEGESAELYAGAPVTEAQFMTAMGDIATGLEELPLLEVTLHFSVQIGSGSEAAECTRVLRDGSYSEDRLGALYGDPVGDFGYGGETVYSVYRISDDGGNVFAVRNRTDEELFAKYYPWFAECVWYVNGEPYGGVFPLLIPPEGAGLVRFPDAGSVWRSLELPDGTPLRLELRIPVPGQEIEAEMMTLDLGQIGG